MKHFTYCTVELDIMRIVHFDEAYASSMTSHNLHMHAIPNIHFLRFPFPSIAFQFVLIPAFLRGGGFRTAVFGFPDLDAGAAEGSARGRLVLGLSGASLLAGVLAASFLARFFLRVFLHGLIYSAGRK